MELYLGQNYDTYEEIRLPLFEVGSMLIAGKTGSGKSVYLHAMIKRLLAENNQDSLGLLLYDGKRIEFHKLKNDPHLMLPIGREASDFEKQVAFLIDLLGKRTPSDPPILFAVDELADAPIWNPGVMESLERLLEEGPAYGVHLILATQTEIRFSEKMLNLAGIKMSFAQYEADSLRFLGDDRAVSLEQGELIAIVKGKQQIKARIEM